MIPADFRAYIQTLRANIEQGNATEHTHRPALQTLLETDDGISAINEPKRIDCGAPDFAIVKSGDNPLSIGYIETKDIGANLDNVENDGQLKRYRAGLSNLILTNYTEFRWYVDGELQVSATLARPDSKGSLVITDAGISDTGVLLGNFLSRSPESVGDSAELARRMARLTHIIRDVVSQSFAQDSVSQDVKDLYQASREYLVPDLTTDDFADMFAQTLAYGLFAARINQDAGPFRRQMAAFHIPPTNPFIRQIFTLVAGPNLDDEPFVSFVDDLAQLLNNSDMSAVLADFGQRSVRQDPIMNFYETFLAAYDPAQRERRGVYYTPEPVISYIVRSVDYLLREKFDCPDGLADYSATEYDSQDDGGNPIRKQSHRVLVLDPACGTGSFLYAVIDHIREHYRSANLGGMWSGYVAEHLLPRLFGFELLMAPYAMAHLKLGLQLAAQDLPAEHRAGWGYQFNPDERLGVYLTNSLEPTTPQASLPGPFRAITDEANAAAEVKSALPIMVVLGNPPYSGHSANKGEWIGKLIDDYKQVDGQSLGERNTKWLQDDYVKFIRFGQWRIQQSGAGILAFITNHAYLINPTFRGMRQQLLDTFTDIYLLDLHGNSRTRERTPEGGVDQNVFDIQQGVAVAIFVKEAGKPGPAKVHHADLWGTRDEKYATLSELEKSNTHWEKLHPTSPDYRFKPWDNELEDEYRQWPSIPEVMPLNSVGIVTARDSLTIRWTRDNIMAVVQDFASLPPETARAKYNLGRDVRD
ncbi:MAG: N-6 DNA methylase [Chloroflexi bacterium]|nr:N-6 DNA methylase [Chloroflexota bacterium]